MYRDIGTELDRLMDRASTSALKSLDAKVDVQSMLRDLLRRAEASDEQTEVDHARHQ